MKLSDLLSRHQLPAEVIEHLLAQEREIARLKAQPVAPLPNTPWLEPVYVPMPSRERKLWPDEPPFERYTITCQTTPLDAYGANGFTNAPAGAPSISTHHFRGYQ